jgi:hypothetical protein
VSQKKNVIVPRGFTSDDVEHRFNSDKFPRLTNREASALHSEGRIQPLGSSGKVWQLTDDSFAHSSRPTGDGRVSLEIPFPLQSFMESEMRRRPSWCVTI